MPEPERKSFHSYIRYWWSTQIIPIIYTKIIELNALCSSIFHSYKCYSMFVWWSCSIPFSHILPFWSRYRCIVYHHFSWFQHGLNDAFIWRLKKINITCCRATEWPSRDAICWPVSTWKKHPNSGDTRRSLRQMCWNLTWCSHDYHDSWWFNHE